MHISIGRRQLVALNLPPLELLRNVPEGPVRFGTHLGSFVNESNASDLSPCNGTLLFGAANGMAPFTIRFGHPMEAACTECALRIPLNSSDRHGWEAAVIAWMRTAHSFGLYFSIRERVGAPALQEICFRDSAWFSLRTTMPPLGSIVNPYVLRDHVPQANDSPYGILFPSLREDTIVASMPELSTAQGTMVLTAIATILPRHHPPVEAPRKRDSAADTLFGLKPEAKSAEGIAALTSLKAFAPPGTYRDN